jgi:hypothetical protein
MPSYPLLNRFRTPLLSPHSTDEDFRLGQSDQGHNLFYVPFEHVNAGARLVLVGITPGPTQMALARKVARLQLLSGELDEAVLVKAKQVAAFAGMRDRINQMLDHFCIPRLLGLGSASDLWESEFGHFQPTSLVPNAAFRGTAYFNGPFESILAVPLLRDQFENSFVPSLSLLPSEAVFIAMGPVVNQGLTWCADRGLLQRQQLLGYFPHASGNSGSQFGYFMRQKRLSDLKPRDPVRFRAHDLDAAYKEIANNVKARLPG